MNTSLTQIERCILEAVKESNQPLGWYGIETKLISKMSYNSRGEGFWLPSILRYLVEAGFLELIVDCGYSVTPLGASMLD